MSGPVWVLLDVTDGAEKWRRVSRESWRQALTDPPAGCESSIVTIRSDSGQAVAEICVIADFRITPGQSVRISNRFLERVGGESVNTVHKRDWSTMARAAGRLCGVLGPGTERLAIAGSIRRGVYKPKDIEIVAIADGDKLDQICDQLLATGQARKRRNSRGNAIAWGARFKAFEWCEPGSDDWIPVDLFITSPGQWGLIYMIRTGPGRPPAGFDRWRGGLSQMIVTQREKGGLLPSDLHVSDGWIWRLGERVPIYEESALFALLGLPYIAPPDRDIPHVLRLARQAGHQHAESAPTPSRAACVYKPLGRGYEAITMSDLIRWAGGDVR